MERPRVDRESREREAFIEMAVANLGATSRTSGGVSDVSEASPDKPKLVIEGEHLADKTEANFRVALAYAWTQKGRTFESGQEVDDFISRIAGMVSRDLLQPGQRNRRTWETPYHTRVDDVPRLWNGFCSKFQRRLTDSGGDPLVTAAWVEQEVDGRIHPFADGCGRTAKVLSAFVLARADHPLPVFRDRKEYYGNINVPTDEWVRHYRTYFPAE